MEWYWWCIVGALIAVYILILVYEERTAWEDDKICKTCAWYDVCETRKAECCTRYTYGGKK